MKCIILGANGFIGSHTVDFLKKEFGYAASFAKNDYKYDNEVTNFNGNFNNYEAIENAISGHDCVIHSISSSTPAIASQNPMLDIQANLIPTISLVHAMAKKKIKKLIYLSSGGTVYGNQVMLPVNENTELRPDSIYGATKISIENYITILCKQERINLTIIRPSNVYGPRQFFKGAQGLIAALLENAIKKQPITLFDNGHSVRDFIYIDDFVYAIYKAIINDAVGVYNISYDKGYSVKKIVNLVEEETGHNFDRNLKPKREFDIDEIILDSSKARKDLDWQPIISIREGIKRHFNWMKDIK